MKKLLKKLLQVILGIPTTIEAISIAKESKLEAYKKFAEELLLTTDLNLENVLVHDLGMFGQAGKTYMNHTTCGGEDEYKINIPHPDKPYIIVPEIKCWWTFRAWIHEIGHHTNKHYSYSGVTYIKEYEAEKFTLEQIEKCDAVDWSDNWDIKFSARCYLYFHILSAVEKGEIETLDDISTKIVEFMSKSKSLKEGLEEDFNTSRKKYLKEKFA